ncbi:DUF4829 domain-containing protein [Romboutsia weinsteinii]|uniref:DUF4829 domain-containing protein n=1 Tax=Romboutsia weinsteinii TaxID=2020949 RepID=A0A255I8M2_9FIRM|nr:DUF4829 domain-containing protein [Romboutsia weinsteinii]RDY28345.1 DUF4829 domain-containing protein [Romboutsia weinsteinii]
MTRGNQRIALLILIPMLIFTYFITVYSQTKSHNYPEKVIYEYFEYKNEKDIESISKLLYNPQDISYIQLEINNLNNISLISVIEEKDESLITAYTKYNNEFSERNVKIYKVKYQVSYNSDSSRYDQSGIYESWCFLTKNNSNSKWYIDILDI